VGGFEWKKMPFFRLVRQILQSKSGIFGEKFNEARRENGFFTAKDSHRNKSIFHNKKTSFRALPKGGFEYSERT